MEHFSNRALRDGLSGLGLGPALLVFLLSDYLSFVIALPLIFVLPNVHVHSQLTSKKKIWAADMDTKKKRSFRLPFAVIWEASLCWSWSSHLIARFSSFSSLWWRKLYLVPGIYDSVWAFLLSVDEFLLIFILSEVLCSQYFHNKL